MAKKKQLTGKGKEKYHPLCSQPILYLAVLLLTAFPAKSPPPSVPLTSEIHFFVHPVNIYAMRVTVLCYQDSLYSHSLTLV